MGNWSLFGFFFVQNQWNYDVLNTDAGTYTWKKPPGEQKSKKISINFRPWGSRICSQQFFSPEPTSRKKFIFKFRVILSIFQWQKRIFSWFSPKKWNSETRFEISVKNQLNHPRGFLDPAVLEKNICFEKSVIIFEVGFFEKKKFWPAFLFSKNPRGWLSWFLTLISNLPVEFYFYSENLEKSPYFHRQNYLRGHENTAEFISTTDPGSKKYLLPPAF